MADGDDAFVERLRVDNSLLLRFVGAPDIPGAIRSEGFELSEKMEHYAVSSVEKIRTYVTDQVHVLEAKVQIADGRLVMPANSGNGAGVW